MATTTRTINRSRKSSGRMFDYIYDENYTESSARDQGRLTRKDTMAHLHLGRIPIFPSMFSELPHYPRSQLSVKTRCLLPPHLAREGRNWATQTSLICDPSEGMATRGLHNLATDLSGRNWHRYCTYTSLPFRRPRIIPKINFPISESSSVSDAAVKSVEVQTDYRDSDVQTDPYSPPYSNISGEATELISLAVLSWGRGLPAGLEEVKLIGRLRRKRVWEASLRATRDLSQLEQLRFITLIEANEWSAREHDIESLQEARLEVMKRLLAEREDSEQKKMARFMDTLWAGKQRDKEVMIQKIRAAHMKALRRITQQRAKVQASRTKRNIITDYSDRGSQVYAPMPRLGSFADRNSQMYVVTSKHLSTYEGLLELEASLPDFVLSPRVQRPMHPLAMRQARAVPRLCLNKRDFLEEYGTDIICQSRVPTDQSTTCEPRSFSAVSKVSTLSEDEKTSTTESSGKKKRKLTLKEMRQSFRNAQTITQPTTPQNEMLEDYPQKVTSLDHEETISFAATLIQQVIRGRVVQNRMLEGKALYHDLINEVKATRLFDNTVEQKFKKHTKNLTLDLQEKRKKHEHTESMVNEALGELESKSLGEALDFLSKELERLQEERRIHAFMILCERERRLREISEGRKREDEQRRRQEEDEIFKEVVKNHQCSVDAFLEQIISSKLEEISDEQSRSEIRRQAEAINKLAYEIEDNLDPITSEEIVADLVHSFLVPEANKEFIRQKVRRTQRRFLVAAHAQIFMGSQLMYPEFRVTPPTPSRHGSITSPFL